MPKNRKHKVAFGLQLWVTAAFLLLIILTSAIIVGYTDTGHQDATLDQSRRLIDQVSATVSHRASAYLAPAVDATKLMAEAYSGDTSLSANLHEPSPLRSLMIALMSVHPQLESIYVADQRGEFLQIRRHWTDLTVPEGGLVGRQIGLFDKGRQETVSLFTRPGSLWHSTPVEQQQKTQYDPRRRPWYRESAKLGRALWTDAYTFYTSRALGVTMARPVRDKTGRVIAVAAADITLSDLSAFLGTQRASEHGITFLINPGGQVVAHPDLPSVRAQQAKNPTVQTLGVPGLAAALQQHQTTGQRELRMPYDDRESIVAFAPLSEASHTDWILVVIIPLDDLLGPTRSIRNKALLIALLVLTVAAVLSVFVSRRLSHPIHSLARSIRHLKGLRFDQDFTLPSRIREVLLMSEALSAMQAALQSFSRYVSADLVRKLMLSGEVARLGGEERDVTILFSDVRGYSTLIEKMAPRDVVEMLNTYFGAMQQIIEDHQGVVLEYIGDAILVVFGAPADLPDHPAQAVRCAAAMRERLVDLNAAWDAQGLARRWQALGIASFQVRIGIHTGSVIAGNLGSRTHMKYGVVGDTVNVAARLEALNKQLRTDVLISAEVVHCLPAQLAAELSYEGQHKLKGRGQVQKVYSLPAASPASEG